MSRRVVVVGSGAAGTAAALAARRAGATVSLVMGRPGATALTSGALDGLVPEEHDVLDALALHVLGPCKLATVTGIVRNAAGRDASLCDLGASRGTVLLPRIPHPEWDADALAAAFAESDPSRRYVTRDADLLLYGKERAMTHTELASLHDDDERLGRTGERLRAALADGDACDTVLLPPWLGILAPRGVALSQLVGVPCGEILVGAFGPAGHRFEHARDRALSSAGVETIAGVAKRVTATEVVTAERTLTCDAVVLATGGLVGGGIAYVAGAGPTFELTYEADATLGHDGKPLIVAGSIHGVPPESLVWPAQSPLLERVGILRTGPGLTVAGDAVADAPRTLLSAFASGTRAGRSAATAG